MKPELERYRLKKMELAREKYASNPILCGYCGTAIPYEKRFDNKFCNKSCSASYNNAKFHKRIAKAKQCRHCGSAVEGRGNKYCDACIGKVRHAIKVTSVSDFKSDRRRRYFLLRTREHKCAVCGLLEWMGSEIPLQMDHIDGDSTNNSDSNLRLLCPNCHAQTPTYMGKNRGKGRRARMSRYRAGKSF